MNQYWLNMSDIFVRRHSVKAWLLSGVSCLALAGCSTALSPHNGKAHPGLVADYFSVDCADIWSRSGENSDENPLYWLREMDCASRQKPVQARAQAMLYANDSWQDAFRRGILLANANIEPVERREMVARLDNFAPQIAAQVRPLYQLWRAEQGGQLQLLEARSRYTRLQQTSDAELEVLRGRQQLLHSQLELTTRKLESLTDIERQLSSRKPGAHFNSEGNGGAEVNHDAP